jgi:hypothetical protein
MSASSPRSITFSLLQRGLVAIRLAAVAAGLFHGVNATSVRCH